MRKRLIQIFFMTLTILLSTVIYFEYRKLTTPVLSQMPEGGDFSLPTAKGNIKLSDYDDKVVLLYFGYTFCPDICPTTLSTFSQVMKELSVEDQGKVKVILISVDPERDSLEKLLEYVSFFNPHFIAGTDTAEKINEIAKLYGVKYEKFFPKAAESYYVVDHSTQAFMVKKQKVVELLHHGMLPDEIIEYIHRYTK